MKPDLAKKLFSLESNLIKNFMINTPQEEAIFLKLRQLIATLKISQAKGAANEIRVVLKKLNDTPQSKKFYDAVFELQIFLARNWCLNRTENEIPVDIFYEPILDVNSRNVIAFSNGYIHTKASVNKFYATSCAYENNEPVYLEYRQPLSAKDKKNLIKYINFGRSSLMGLIRNFFTEAREYELNERQSAQLIYMLFASLVVGIPLVIGFFFYMLPATAIILSISALIGGGCQLYKNWQHPMSILGRFSEFALMACLTFATGLITTCTAYLIFSGLLSVCMPAAFLLFANSLFQIFMASLQLMLGVFSEPLWGGRFSTVFLAPAFCITLLPALVFVGVFKLSQAGIKRVARLFSREMAPSEEAPEAHYPNSQRLFLGHENVQSAGSSSSYSEHSPSSSLEEDRFFSSGYSRYPVYYRNPSRGEVVIHPGLYLQR